LKKSNQYHVKILYIVKCCRLQHTNSYRRLKNGFSNREKSAKPSNDCLKTVTICAVVIYAQKNVLFK